MPKKYRMPLLALLAWICPSSVMATPPYVQATVVAVVALSRQTAATTARLDPTPVCVQVCGEVVPAVGVADDTASNATAIGHPLLAPDDIRQHVDGCGRDLHAELEESRHRDHGLAAEREL